MRSALKEVERNQTAPPDELFALQQERFRSILHQACHHVPHYRNLFDERSLGPGDIRDFDDLEQLPILRRQQIADAPQDFCADNIPPRRRLKTISGGTTGPGLTTFWDYRGRDMAVAVLMRGARWAGLQPGEPYAIPYGVPSLHGCRREAWLERLNYWGRNVLVTHTLPATADGVSRTLTEIRAFRAKQVYGCPSFLEEMALTAPDACRSLKLRGILTSGEMLFPHQRSAIEEAFGCRVFDRYGSAEVDTVCQECGTQPGHLHISAETCWVEIVDPDGRCVPRGDAGEIVVTSLVNRAMPLIRYSLGDLGRLEEIPCRCGRTLPLMQIVEGRMYDTIIDTQGRRVPAGFLLYLFRGLPGIREVQLVQKEPFSLLVRAVRTPELTDETLDHCRRTITDALGHGSSVHFEFVPVIERTGAGKFRYTISTLHGNNSWQQ
jgi:phenylacetate-CoA ligase